MNKSQITKSTLSKKLTLKQTEKKGWKIALKLIVIFILVTTMYATAYWLLTEYTAHGLRTTTDKQQIDYIYFSVVTISTLGYGDIIPVGYSRFLVCSEVLFGLIFVGYSLSQVLSARQEYLIEYLTNDRILQTYSECLAKVTDAKELIGDHRRDLVAGTLNPMIFIYNRGNPFYPALKAIHMLNGYTAHVTEIGRGHTLSTQIERAAHHVEELASFARKYINILQAAKAPWKTRRTKRILKDLCSAIENFNSYYTEYTRYSKEEYKGGGKYQEIVNLITAEIRSQL